ncbi:MAG: glycosyltransferase, partial [Pseudomonadota bacterium]
MRVLALSSHSDTLNSVRPEAELFIGLAAAGLDLTVMTQGDSVYAGAMRDAGIRVIDFVPARKLSLAAIRRLRAELAGGGYDIVYSFNNKAIG